MCTQPYVSTYIPQSHSYPHSNIQTYIYIYLSICLSISTQTHRWFSCRRQKKNKKEKKEKAGNETRQRKRKKKKFCLDPVPAFLSGNCFPKEGISCPPIPRLRTKPVNSSQEKTETLGLGNIFKSAKMISLFC